MKTKFELLGFQSRAARQIADRYLMLEADDERPAFNRKTLVPYFQALSALTGAGKTPILAEAVAQMSAVMAPKPLVLWTTRLRVVVEQSRVNLQPGGKYNSLVHGFSILPLADLSRDAIADATTPFIVTATVGSFNQADKEEGSLAVHALRQDEGDTSLWSALTERKTPDGRRPLIIVYDEGHNLSDQQTDMLLGLEPDAILVASATMSMPGRLGRTLQYLQDAGWNFASHDDEPGKAEPFLITQVSNAAVVDAGLVKRQVDLGGYTSHMETLVDDLLEAMDLADKKAVELDAGFRPKAIFVCQTNINPEDGSHDLPTKPFDQRKAPPIAIWRYLVGKKGIDPSEIAVYCNLEVDKTHHPLPSSFNLFSGGDKDYTKFSEGNFRYIIFNQSLQEGWDDPACAFAYIDKTMGSKTQVEQVIGRVLRQPGAMHYADPALNTATFFIRLTDSQEFPSILSSVQAKLGAEPGGVQVLGFEDGRAHKKARQEPKKLLTVPQIHIHADDSEGPIDDIVSRLPDFRKGGDLTEGKGIVHRASKKVGDDAAADVITLDLPHSNRVTTRWLAARQMRGQFPAAVAAVNWADHRFDARVEITSHAADVYQRAGAELVDAFLDNSRLIFEESNLYKVSAVDAIPGKSIPFKNAAHDAYTLNTEEAPIAQAIDARGYDWVRNPENGGFYIPLLEKGDTYRFFPDFLVWKDGVVFAIDPKGGHLLGRDAWRKVLNIEDEKGKRRVLVRLISTDKWNDDAKQIDKGGFTVWYTQKGTSKLKARHVATVAEAVDFALKP